MIILTSNIIFVGDIPKCPNYIDGYNIKPTDTRFKVDDKFVLFFDGVPENIDQYLEYSKYPIHIFVDDINKISKEVKGKFEIVDNGDNIPFIQIIHNIFYNPDRKQVYEILVKNKPPIVPLHMWIQQNILRVYQDIPTISLILDEYVIPDKTKTNPCLDDEYYYSLVSYGLKNTTNVRQLKWLKQKKEN